MIPPAVLRVLAAVAIICTLVIALIAPRWVWLAIGVLAGVLVLALIAYEQESHLFDAANRALFLTLGQLEEQKQPPARSVALTPGAPPVVWPFDRPMN